MQIVLRLHILPGSKEEPMWLVNVIGHMRVGPSADSGREMSHRHKRSAKGVAEATEARRADLLRRIDIWLWRGGV